MTLRYTRRIYSIRYSTYVQPESPYARRGGVDIDTRVGTVEDCSGPCATARGESTCSLERVGEALAEVLGLPVHYEPVTDNVYLEDFYKDMKRYGFPLQIYLLNKRYRQQQQIVWEGRGGVQDRTIYEDAIFAKMLRECVDPLIEIEPTLPCPLC